MPFEVISSDTEVVLCVLMNKKYIIVGECIFFFLSELYIGSSSACTFDIFIVHVSLWEKYFSIGLIEILFYIFVSFIS